MDTIRKSTHLDPDEMLELLRTIGADGIRAAITAWVARERPKNDGRFREARRWAVVDEAGNKYAHRPLIALACEQCGLPEMNPDNFGLPNDGVCKKWFDLEGFVVGPAD